MLSQDLMNILVCPVCKGTLTASTGNEQNVLCKSCAIVFPVREGIPVMLVDEATPQIK